MTNGDMIRAMDDDELAHFLDELTFHCQDADCQQCIIGCRIDSDGKPFCGSDNIKAWVKRRAEQ